MKLPYQEGSVCLVPLVGGGWARGVIARVPRRGRVLVGYFFGPILESTEGVRLDDLLPERAILRLRFGDLGLIERRWPVVGTVSVWERARWPIPVFVRFDLLVPGRAILVRYDEDDPRIEIANTPSTEHAGLPEDGLDGAGAVELSLSMRLGRAVPEH